MTVPSGASRRRRGLLFATPSVPGSFRLLPLFAQAAKESRAFKCVVKHCRQISAREDAKSHAAQDHWLAERVFAGSGLNGRTPAANVISQSGCCYLAPMIRAGLLHVAPSAPAVMRPIAAEDQAARVYRGDFGEPQSGHGGKAYPLYGPVEFTYQGIADVLSRVLGKEVQYKQVSFETMLQDDGLPEGKSLRPDHNARALYGEFETGTRPPGPGDSFAMQHLRGGRHRPPRTGSSPARTTWSKTIGGWPATTLEAFIDKHRAAFA